jgi:Flp pilus assembly protein TadD
VELRGRAIWLMDRRREPSLRVSRPALGQPNAAWHAEQAVQAERAKQWFAAGFHLEQQARARPWDVELRKREAHAWKKAGQGDRAARTFVPMILLGVP